MTNNYNFYKAIEELNIDKVKQLLKKNKIRKGEVVGIIHSACIRNYSSYSFASPEYINEVIYDSITIEIFKNKVIKTYLKEKYIDLYNFLSIKERKYKLDNF